MRRSIPSGVHLRREQPRRAFDEFLEGTFERAAIVDQRVQLVHHRESLPRDLPEGVDLRDAGAFERRHDDVRARIGILRDLLQRIE